MKDNHRQKVFIPPKKRLILSRLKEDILNIGVLILIWVLFDKVNIQLIAFGIFVIGIFEVLRVTHNLKGQAEELKIIISDQDIYGLPEAPWFNGFRELEKIRIPLHEIDKQKTRIEKAWYSSANLIWSTDGKRILVSGAFEEAQLREMGRLIGCPVEI